MPANDRCVRRAEVEEDMPARRRRGRRGAERVAERGQDRRAVVDVTVAVDEDAVESGVGQRTNELGGRLVRKGAGPGVTRPTEHRRVAPAKGAGVEVGLERIVVHQLRVRHTAALREAEVRQLEDLRAGRKPRLEPMDERGIGVIVAGAPPRTAASSPASPGRTARRTRPRGQQHAGAAPRRQSRSSSSATQKNARTRCKRAARVRPDLR